MRPFSTWGPCGLAQPKCHYKTARSTAPWAPPRRKTQGSSWTTSRGSVQGFAHHKQVVSKPPPSILAICKALLQLQMPRWMLLRTRPGRRRRGALGVHSCAFLGSLQKVCWALRLWTHQGLGILYLNAGLRSLEMLTSLSGSAFDPPSVAVGRWAEGVRAGTAVCQAPCGQSLNISFF